jgi:hypothetical protein
VTLTENVQEPLAAIVLPVKLILCEPPAAVTMPLPQVPVSPFGVDTINPAGSVSANATPASATTELGFVIVKLSDVELVRPIDAAPNALLIEGGVATDRFADAVLPVPPLVEVTLVVVLV